jgi:hypothetical protein
MASSPAQVLCLAAACAALLGCGRTELSPPVDAGVPPPVDSGQPSVEHAARFVGLWMVDQPTHAGYESSYFELEASGRVRPAGSWGGSPTATVAPASGGALLCEFGAAWHSVGTTLIIDGVCTDGVARPIALQFLTPASQNSDSAEVSIDSVGGAPGWVHPGWPWRLRKCPAGTTSPVPFGCGN